MSAPTTSEEQQHSAAVEDVIRRAQSLVSTYPGCFWFWKQGVRVTSIEQAQLVVHHLRENGGREEWVAAQALYQCLSQTTSDPS